ncbi:MAG: PhnE/PtxC family ABC transporter permease [Bdellovibrio sp.]|jgi:phosphonate transport system permease protein
MRIKSKTLFGWLALLVLIALAWPAFQGSDRDLDSVGSFLHFFVRFFPPDFSDGQELLNGLIETAQIGFLATVIAAVLSLGLGLLGGPWVHRSGQFSVLSLFALIRSVPSLVWAVIAVAAVGPFPRAGVIALTFYSIGYLGKFLLDDLRTLNMDLTRMYLRWGLSPLWSFYLGFWPQLKARYLAHCVWMLEYNIRSAAIIGYVGAGGLGLRLHAYQEYGQWRRFCAVLIMILAIVLLFEIVSRFQGRPKRRAN